MTILKKKYLKKGEIMSKRIMIILSVGCAVLGVVAGTYIFSKLSHNKAYERDYLLIVR